MSPHRPVDVDRKRDKNMKSEPRGQKEDEVIQEEVGMKSS